MKLPLLPLTAIALIGSVGAVAAADHSAMSNSVIDVVYRFNGQRQPFADPGPGEVGLARPQ